MMIEATTTASFTQTEEETRRYWQRHEVAETARAARREGRPYVIYQQPLDLLAPPWTDQIRLLCTSDLFARYHTMRGDAVHSVTGWACHGQALEVEVERSLGPALADCDVAEFNAICRDTATEGIRLVEAQARRLGVWLDPEHTFSSMATRSIGAVWRALYRLWEAGRLKPQQRVEAYCTRCATHLSPAEAAERLVEADVGPVWVRIPWDGEADAYFLVQASDPWMLMGMVALAVHPDATYILAEPAVRQESTPTHVLVAEAAAARSLPDGFRPVRELRGKELRDARFRPLFTFLPDTAATGRVVLSPSVPLDRGSGIMPVMPAFDGISLELAPAHGLPIPQLLDEWGSLDEMVASWRGLSPWDAEPLLVEDLQARGLLFRQEPNQHRKALCPHCATPLLQLARQVWLVGSKDDTRVVDRARPWGAPLPIWKCRGCAEQLCMAGLDDLAHRTDLDLDEIDLHRPEVDGLTFACRSCGGLMQRVTPVVDTAFELAVLSTAEASPPAPADLAIGLDPTHSHWLQDLSAVSTILQQPPAYQHAISVPTTAFARGWEQTRAFSGDAFRWATYTNTTPRQAERGFLQQVRRLVQAFSSELVPDHDWHRHQLGTAEVLLDHWLLARLHETIRAVTEALDGGRVSDAAGSLVALVEDINSWYVVYRPGRGEDLLGTVCSLMAPFSPHLSEIIYSQIEGQAAPSVHLTDWPSPDPAWQDSKLLAQMTLIRQLAALGDTARAQADMDPDVTLDRALVATLSALTAPAGELTLFEGLLADALRVTRVEFTPDAEHQVEWQLLPIADRLVSRAVPAAEIAASLAELDSEAAADLAAQLRAGYSTSMQVSGRAITLLPDEVQISAKARPGWAAAVEGPCLLVLVPA